MLHFLDYSLRSDELDVCDAFVKNKGKQFKITCSIYQNNVIVYISDSNLTKVTVDGNMILINIPLYRQFI